jgi:hypothetical protein
MKIKKIEYVDGMQGEAVISLNRDELFGLCNGLFLLSKQKDSKYDKQLHTQMRVIRDILDYGAVDDFTFNTAVE